MICEDFFFLGTRRKAQRKAGIRDLFRDLRGPNPKWVTNDGNDESLSFRAAAFFCVMGFKFQEYKLEIKDELDPVPEIQAVLQAIEEEVVVKHNAIRSLSDYRAELLKVEDERIYSGVGEGIVTSLIEEGFYDEALAKMDQYKAQKKSSNMCFGSSNNDFYAVARKYCQEKKR